VASGKERGARRQTYIALLRGVNLGARNKVSMADLRTLVESLGAEDVTTYVQSGNVVFKSPDSAVDLAGGIEEQIKRDLGLNVTVLMFTKAQLAKVLAGNPFVDGGRDPKRLHVTFLAGAPHRDRVRRVVAKQFEPDEFHVAGLVIYLHCPNGYGRSKLSNAYLEKQLGVPATTRNWNTVTKLVELTERA
jgi:uncharacterized protein (DUF1697 family)